MASDVTTAPATIDETPAAPTPPRRASSALGAYQPGLDGMRGFAMLYMLAYHAELAWARGAFLALSQFFTLSGFLITGVLLRNHVKSDGDLRSFWNRRVRRLMPAAVVAMAGIALYGATVATRQQVDALPGDIVSAATWTANWHFILSGRSYIDLFAAPSPAQHFWSLAIEEQFYLLLPLVLLFVVRRTRSPRVLFAAFGTGAVVSTLWMVALYQGGASLDRLYYGTDTRMAELLVGAALAVVISRTGIDFSERVRRILAGVGLVCFAASLWCWLNIPLADGPIWRGGFFGYSLLSCGVILGVLAGKAPLVTFLSFRPFVYVGRISYGVYLYHWPVFLWLTESRTGLGQWPLLALRLAVTFTLAILSYHLIERPIMRGRTLGLRGAARAAIIPVALVVVVMLTIFTVNTSASDPLATLRADAAMPRVASDGVLDVLVVPPRAHDPVIAELSHMVRGDASVKLSIAPPFRCKGGLVETAHGRTCANWARTWPALVARHDPDAVVLYADDWAGQPLDQLAGDPSREAQQATAQAILSAGFDLLTARGAPIVWATSGTDFARAIQRSQRPLSQAMSPLQLHRTDIYRVVGTQMPDPATVSRSKYLSQSATALLDDASLYQRAKDRGLPRVMVVGDSQSESLGYGLDRWAAQHNRALVWNRGVEGCGVVVAGVVRSFGSTDSGQDRCRTAAQSWPHDLRAFDPNVVVVLSSITDLQDRRLPGEPSFSSVGDPAFDAFLVKQYEHVVDTLSATGARVVWMTPPCAAIHSAAGQQAYDSTKVDYLNSKILPKVERDRANTMVQFDLDRVICPGGKARQSVPGVGELRPDGVHFSVGGALWFARTYGDKLLKIAGV